MFDDIIREMIMKERTGKHSTALCSVLAQIENNRRLEFSSIKISDEFREIGMWTEHEVRDKQLTKMISSLFRTEIVGRCRLRISKSADESSLSFKSESPDNFERFVPGVANDQKQTELFVCYYSISTPVKFS